MAEPNLTPQSLADPTPVLIAGLRRGAAWVRAVDGAPDFVIAALVDPDAARLAEVGDEFGVPDRARFSDLEQAEAAGVAQIAVLATPPTLHKDHSIAALRAGLHVICEKPVVMTVDEAVELRRAAEGLPHRLMIGEQYRFAAGARNLTRALGEGLIGRPLYIAHDCLRATALAPSIWDVPDHWSSSYEVVPLQDRAIHHFDLWLAFTGSRVREIAVRTFDTPLNPSRIIFGLTVMGVLENGTVIHYMTGKSIGRRPTSDYGTVVIGGETGTLWWDGETTTVEHVPSGSERGELLDYEAGDQPSSREPLTRMLRELAASIREGRLHECALEENLASFWTVEAGLKSVRNGGIPVRVEAPVADRSPAR